MDYCPECGHETCVCVARVQALEALLADTQRENAELREQVAHLDGLLQGLHDQQIIVYVRDGEPQHSSSDVDSGE